jgi:hypothetical protein
VVVKRFAVFGDRLVVLDAAKTVVSTLVLQGQEWELTIGGRAYRVVRRLGKDAIGRREEKLQILSAAGLVVPPGGDLTAPVPAPLGSSCHAHEGDGATRVCPLWSRWRCGSQRRCCCFGCFHQADAQCPGAGSTTAHISTKYSHV